MPKNTAAPKVPGETASSEPLTGNQTPNAGTPPADASGSGVQTEAKTDSETVVVPKAQLEALLARVSALESDKQNVAAKVANPDADLPDQDKIDPDTLKSPVLSKQGWVLPTNYGANPAQKGL